MSVGVCPIHELHNFQKKPLKREWPTLKLLSRNCVKIAVFPTSVCPRITTRAVADIESLGFICKCHTDDDVSEQIIEMMT